MALEDKSKASGSATVGGAEGSATAAFGSSKASDGTTTTEGSATGASVGWYVDHGDGCLG